jgi:hypothetical protein
MYIRLVNDIPEKVTLSSLRTVYPNVSFPKIPSEEALAEYDIYPLQETFPIYDSATQVAAEGTPVLDAGVWKQSWTIRTKTTEELEVEAKQLQEEQDRIAIKTDGLVQAFIDRTPAQINTYINSQVTDLASAREMLKLFGRILLIVARREYK